jgi:putative flavoprotein involved in K+ transport
MAVMTSTPQHFDSVIIGGGQAGLATGYHLAQRGRQFVILDANERVGDAWRKRWDSLRLFTPAGHDGLPGMRIPAPAWSFPTRDELADYLETYARHFELPVRNGVCVDGLGRADGRYLIAAGDERYAADNVVIATGAYQQPRTPEFATELDPRIVQMHSFDYRNPSQLQAGPVLVVGAGNSGADVALDVAATHETYISGEHPGHLPINTVGLSGRLAFPLIWFTWTNILKRSTPIGRKVRGKVLAGPEPLIRVKPKHIDAAGITRVGRTTGVQGGRPVVDRGVMDVANVVWCTGYRDDYDWLDLPVDRDEFGQPAGTRGIVETHPGLYFVGREFQFSFNSHLVGGVGRDAGHVADQIAARTPLGARERQRATRPGNRPGHRAIARS